MDQEQKIKELLSLPKDIVIITHRNPDGDALGSSLALKLFLDQLGHSVNVVLPSEYPNNYLFLPDLANCVIYDLFQEKALELLKHAQVIFCLDFNGLDRIDKMGIVINESKASKILIDHHLDPEPFYDFGYSDTSASSTCEMVYDFIVKIGFEEKINKDIGACILTGIITDTGSFKYSTNPNCYKVAGKIKALGVDDYAINDFIYNSMTEKQLKLLGHCLVNRMEIIKEYGTGIIALTKDDYHKYKIGRGDTEGIVNYVLLMKGINVAAFIREQPTIIKMSLRSKGDISVAEIARNHFKGGGHKNAAGGAQYGKLQNVIAKFKNELPNYIHKIDT